MLLDHVVLEVLGTDVEAERRDQSAPRDRVLPGMCERDELAEPLVIGELEAGHPPDGLEGEIAGALETGCEAGQLPLGRHPVEATDAHVDGMDGPTTDQLDQLVADLLQLQTTLHPVPMVGGEVDDPVVAEEVGRVEEVDVERVALDPLPAVEEAAQVGQGTIDRDAAQRLDGVAGAHLIRHWADAADPGGDVRRLGVGPPPQHRLEEARRLVDPQLHGAQDPVTDDDVHRPLTLDARASVSTRSVRSPSGAVTASRPGRGQRSRRGTAPRRR